MKASFRDQGIAKVARLDQDLGQQACSAATPPSAQATQRIETEAMATIRWPEGGRYFGDWREGEKLAQNGRGMTWSDPSAAPKDNGAGGGPVAVVRNEAAGCVRAAPWPRDSVLRQVAVVG